MHCDVRSLVVSGCVEEGAGLVGHARAVLLRKAADKTGLTGHGDARPRARARAHAWNLIEETPAGFPWVAIADKTLTGWLVIDMDATLVTASSDKEGAAPTGQRGYGFHPPHLMSRAGKWPGGLRWIVRRVKPSRRTTPYLTAWENKTGCRYSISIICTNIPDNGITGVPGSRHLARQRTLTISPGAVGAGAHPGAPDTPPQAQLTTRPFENQLDLYAERTRGGSGREGACSVWARGRRPEPSFTLAQSKIYITTRTRSRLPIPHPW